MQSYKERFEACQDGEVAKNLELLKRLSYSLSQATRWGAIGAAITAGFGDKYESDNLAVNAIREYLNGLDIDGTIVIGEGERDEAPMLYIGERVGTGKGEPLHIAVDPLENTNATAIFAPRAISVLAASEPGGLFHAPDMYMDKLIVGVEAKDKVDLDAPTEVNLKAIAKALGRNVSDLVIVVLDRERNNTLIQNIRSAGARVKLIPDGDLMPGIAAGMKDTGIHAVMGIGAAPEGVITAAGIKCLNGGMQARFTPKDAAQEERLIKMGGDPHRIYRETDLASGKKIIFTATGVTEGELLEGVRFFDHGFRTSSLMMCSLGELRSTYNFFDETYATDKKDFLYKRS